MKKFFTLLCLLLVGGGAFAATPYLSNNPKQVEIYQKHLEEGLATKNYQSAVSYELHIVLGTTTEDISTIEKAEAFTKPILEKYLKLDPEKSYTFYYHYQSGGWIHCRMCFC